MGHDQSKITNALEVHFHGEYSDWRLLNEGGTAWVYYCRKKSIDQPRVLKLLKVSLHDIEVSLSTGEILRRDFPALFREEIQRVLSVSHPNVIKLYDAGTLMLDNAELPWYIMEHLEEPDDLDRALVAMLQHSSDDLGGGRREEDRVGSFTEQMFLRILADICRGIRALHERRVAHLDIKPGNILLSGSGEVRVVDLGFAKSISDLEDESRPPFTLVIADRRFMAEKLLALLSAQRAAIGSAEKSDIRTTAIAIQRKDLEKRAFLFDLVSLGKTFQFVLDNTDVGQVLTPQTEQFLYLVAERLKAADSSAALKYTSIGEALMDLEKLDPKYSVVGLAPELNLVLPTGIRLGGEHDVPATTRVKNLIRCKLIQRLRAVRQLSLAHFVYPGAVHTRFEHSLGVLAMTARYAMALWNSSYDATFRSAVTQEEISALLVAGLFHDIGHYPMAHAFEEVESGRRIQFKHDFIARRILLDQDPKPNIDWDRNQIVSLLETEWGITLEDVVAILSGVGPSKHVRTAVLPMLHSILDSAIDADKADYLFRDSIHTGNPYGSAIDMAKLHQNLTAFNISKPIGIHEKGLRSVERLYMNRYHMFLTVYWHHTKRAAERMLTEAVRIVREAMGPDEFMDWFYRVAFAFDDEGMMEQVRTELENGQVRAQPEDGVVQPENGQVRTRDENMQIACDLINPLRTVACQRDGIYKRVVEITSADPGSTHEYILHFFNEYIGGAADGDKAYLYFDAQVRQAILSRANSKFGFHHVLVDVPDPRPASPAQLDVVDANGDTHTAIRRSSVFRHFNDDWNLHARKVRVFAHPALRAELKAERAEIRKDIERIASEVRAMGAVSKEDNDSAWAELTRKFPPVLPNGTVSNPHHLD